MTRTNTWFYFKCSPRTNVRWTSCICFTLWMCPLFIFRQCFLRMCIELTREYHLEVSMWSTPHKVWMIDLVTWNRSAIAYIHSSKCRLQWNACKRYQLCEEEGVDESNDSVTINVYRSIHEMHIHRYVCLYVHKKHCIINSIIAEALTRKRGDLEWRWKICYIFCA